MLYGLSRVLPLVISHFHLLVKVVCPKALCLSYLVRIAHVLFCFNKKSYCGTVLRTL